MLSDVVQGLNMQMFIYLFALWQNGGKKYGEFTPAGVLYYPANSPLISVDRGTSDEDIETERQKRCSMNGIVLNNAEVVSAMDESESGLYIPAKFKKGELVGSLIGLKQLEKLSYIIIKPDESEKEKTELLDERLLSTPAVAFQVPCG